MKFLIDNALSPIVSSILVSEGVEEHGDRTVDRVAVDGILGRRSGRVDGEEDVGAEGEGRIADRCLDLGGRMEEINPFLRVEEEGEPIACNGEQV